MSPYSSDDEIIIKRILEHFEKVAPSIVKESVKSLETDRPKIDHYDLDFYISHMAGAFDDVEEERLKKLTFESIEKINAVFFKLYKEAKAGKV